MIKTNNSKCKCKECTDRYLGCHDHCEDYKVYRQELDEKNRVRQEKIHENAPFMEKRQRALKVMRQKGKLK